MEKKQVVSFETGEDKLIFEAKSILGAQFNNINFPIMIFLGQGFCWNIDPSDHNKKQLEKIGFNAN